MQKLAKILQSVLHSPPTQTSELFTTLHNDVVLSISLDLLYAFVCFMLCFSFCVFYHIPVFMIMVMFVFNKPTKEVVYYAPYNI